MMQKVIIKQNGIVLLKCPVVRESALTTLDATT